MKDFVKNDLTVSKRAEAKRRHGRGAEQPPKEDAPPDGDLGELPRALRRRDGAPALHAALTSMLLAGDPPDPGAGAIRRCRCRRLLPPFGR